MLPEEEDRGSGAVSYKYTYNKYSLQRVWQIIYNSVILSVSDESIIELNYKLLDLIKFRS